MSSLTRRGFLALTGTAVVGTVLTSCAPQPGEPSQAPAKTGSEAEGSTAAGKGEIVTIRAIERLGAPGDLMTKRVEEFHKTYENIKVDIELYPGAEYFQKAAVLAASGTLYDTVFDPYNRTYLTLASQGVYIDLEPFIEAENIDINKEYYQFLVDEAWRFEGKIHGMTEFSHPSSVGLYINQDLLDEAGVEIPDWDTTFDELTEGIIKLTKRSGDRTEQWGWVMPSVLEEKQHYMVSFGGQWLNEDRTKADPITSEGTQAAFQWLYDLAFEHEVAATADALEGGIYAMFAAGKLAMFQGSYWRKKRTMTAVGDNFPWKVCPMPMGAGDKPGARGAVIQTGLNSVTKWSKHPAEAFQLVRWMSNHDTGMMASLDFSVVPNGRPDVWKDPHLMADPNHVVYATYYEQNPHVQRVPANCRVEEFYNAVQPSWDLILLGKETPEQALPKAQDAGQAVLDKPKP